LVVGPNSAEGGLADRWRAWRARAVTAPASASRRRWNVIVLAALTGAGTGLAVTGFEQLTRRALFEHLHDLPRAAQAAAPLVGLVVAAAVLRWLGKGASPATADEYIHNFHEAEPLPLEPAPARVLASVATLGLGGALGYEGPSLYMGAAIGSALHARCRRMLAGEDPKLLLVAGAAAGVAAIFKAPLTGVVFALEVPYRDDFARRMLMPASVAAAAAYLVFVAFTGTAPLFAVAGSPPFDLRDLGGAALLGVLCGVSARVFALALVAAKRVAASAHRWARAVVGGLVLGGLAGASFALFNQGLTLGPGYDNLAWALDPHRSVGLVLALFAMRAAATWSTVGGGGAGGLFIPLVIEGGLLGRAVSGLFRAAGNGSHFFPLIGVSAFLGAGYRVPLAGVVFAAEASGRPGFVVPGMIATVVAQLFMGRDSVSAYQRGGGGGAA
jgi:CIC family chloride channel protein